VGDPRLEDDIGGVLGLECEPRDLLCFQHCGVKDGLLTARTVDLQGVKLQHVRMGIRCSNDSTRSAGTLPRRHWAISPERRG
jgi:hypothetical protein